MRQAAFNVVLIGDDDAPTLSLAEALERAGMLVRMAVSARMALSEIARGADVIVCDLGASQMHSIEVLLCLRKSSPSATPVVAVSAMPNVSQHCHALGVEHFLAQPFKVSDLVALIGEVTGRDSVVPIPLVMRVSARRVAHPSS